MTILVAILVGILAGLGFVVTEMFWAAAGLSAVWLVGWILRADGTRWYWW